MARLASTATRTAAGTSSRKSPSRFAITSTVKKLMPVALPPGRARLATSPSLTGSIPTPNAMGIARGRGFGRERGGVCRRCDHAHFLADQIGCQLRKPIEAVLRPAILDCYVPAFDIAGFGEPLAERLHETRNRSKRLRVENPYHRQRRLLRARRQRPHRCRAAEQRDELAPL